MPKGWEVGMNYPVTVAEPFVQDSVGSFSVNAQLMADAYCIGFAPITRTNGSPGKNPASTGTI